MRSVAAASLLLAIALSGVPAAAQTQGDANSEQVGSDGAAVQASAVPDESLLSGEDIDALTSPIALYPDPLLELTLQGATFPLQAVQAVRFLEKHAKDPGLAPDPGWDESILGLLNYPVVLEAFNNDLDWTEALGNAVLTQLDDVQESIQQFRSQLYAGGVLKSDEKQRVIVSDEVIAILPADAEIIYVPHYDPAASAHSEEMADTASETSSEMALEPAAVAEAAEVAEADAAADAQEAAPAPAAAPEQTAAATTQPAPVVYSEPYPSYWSPVATFLGGAAIGGLIGYAIGDDDDDDCCDFDDDDWDGGGNDWSKDVNIEDSNIVINRDDDALGNGDRVRPRDVQSELRKRQTRGQTAAVNQRDVQPKGTAPARKARATQPTQQQPAALKKPAQQKAATKTARQRPGDAQAKRADAAALSGAKNTSGKQVKAESRRGSESRAVAKNKAPGKQMQAKTWPQSGGGIAKPKANKQVTRQSNRGKASGGGKRRRG
jgi:hypothetical protein